MYACMVCTTQGIPLVSCGPDNFDWKSCAKLVASIAILITKDDYCEFMANSMMYYVVPLSQSSHTYYCVIIDSKSSAHSMELKMRTHFFANTVNTFYKYTFSQLVLYYDRKTSIELQSSTFSDSLVDDHDDEDIFQTVFNDGNITKDALRVLEDYYLKQLIDIPLSQCALQHCFTALQDELSAHTLCTLHLCRKINDKDISTIYSVGMSGDNRSVLSLGPQSEWMSIVNSHISQPNPKSTVFQILHVEFNSHALLVHTLDRSTALVLLLPMHLLLSSSNVSAAASPPTLLKLDPILCLSPSLLFAWSHTCRCLLHSLPSSMLDDSSLPSETFLKNLFSVAPFSVSPSVIDTTIIQSPLSPSPVSPTMEYLRPVAPTSIKSSHSFTPLNEVTNGDANSSVSSGSSSGVRQTRPGRSFKSSSPQP